MPRSCIAWLPAATPPWPACSQCSLCPSGCAQQNRQPARSCPQRSRTTRGTRCRVTFLTTGSGAALGSWEQRSCTTVPRPKSQPDSGQSAGAIGLARGCGPSAGDASGRPYGHGGGRAAAGRSCPARPEPGGSGLFERSGGAAGRSIHPDGRKEQPCLGRPRRRRAGGQGGCDCGNGYAPGSYRLTVVVPTVAEGDMALNAKINRASSGKPPCCPWWGERGLSVGPPRHAAARRAGLAARAS